MADLTETQAALETYLNNNWSTTEIAWDNVPFVEDKSTAYIAAQFIPYTNRNVTIGAAIDGLKRTRQRGVLSLDIFTPLESGSSAAYAIADSLSALMGNKTIQNVLTYAGDSRRIGKVDAGWYMIVLDIPFTSDD